MICTILGRIIGHKVGEASAVGTCLGIFADTILTVTVGGLILMNNMNTSGYTEKMIVEMANKEQEMNKLLSYDTGLNEFRTVSASCYKDVDGKYKLRLFGDSQDLQEGKNRYSEMKNIEYTITPTQYGEYEESLSQVVNSSYNNAISGKTYSTSFASSPSWKKQAEDYKNKVTDLYDTIGDIATHSSDYVITDCGLTSKMQDILGGEYKYDPTKPTLVSEIEGQWIKTNFINTNFILTDVSPVYSYNNDNYVYVNTLQTDDVRNWYNIEGRFKVKGENLSNEEVYQKIYDGEYEFFKGDKQNTKSQNIAEDNLELVY